MIPEEWERIQEIVDFALDMEPPRRGAYLNRVCNGEAELRRRAEDLISAHDKAGSLFGAAIGARAQVILAGGSGMTIGRYRILRVLGEGGMGVVYEAEQDQPRRAVALKVIRPGFANRMTLRRFELEAQALGRLQHPGIARIYESGTSDTGLGVQPYFAMELIVGHPFLEFSRTQLHTLDERLELMAKVCDAVSHAHQRGIIHRDLKPGNILVDEAGQPKILDFGVARIIDSHADSDTGASLQTDVGQLIGTLTYMSPEQVLADPAGIDTRSDIYSLGVILYELLAGRLPYDTGGRPIDEAVAAIRSVEPASLALIDPKCRGDVETIVRTALEKDKSRRYSSAAGLADDLRRYLKNEPIAARPASAIYQLQKLARRNRPVVLGAAAVLLALVAGVIVSTYLAMRARDAERTALSERNAAIAQKQRADTEQAAALAVTAFLRDDVLAQASANVQASPNTAPDPDLKVRTALDRAAARIDARFQGQPIVEASVRQTIADTYLDLGLPDEARPQIEKTIELRRRTLGEHHSETLFAMERLAMVDKVQGKYQEAEQILTGALAERKRSLGNDNPSTLRCAIDLSAIYIWRGKYGECERLLTPNIARSTGVLGERHPDTVRALSNLAIAYLEQGNNAAAERIEIRLVELTRAAYGEGHPATIRAINNLGNNYDKWGHYDQAEPLFVQAYQLGQTVLGEEHPDALLYANNLADLKRKTGQLDYAEKLYIRTYETRRRVLGEDHPDTLITAMSLGRLYRNRGKTQLAVHLFRHARDVRKRVLGEDHPYTLNSTFEIGRTYESEGRFREAEQLYSNLAPVRSRVMGARHPVAAGDLLALGRTRIALRKFPEAEVALREALRAMDGTPAGWQKFEAQSALGASLAGQRQYDEAEPLLLEGHQGMLQRQPTMPLEDRAALLRSRGWLSDLYIRWGKPEKAARWRPT
jgi:eukaryotic-like serine/threonine-protein kinase